MKKVISVFAISFVITVAVYNVKINESFDRGNDVLLASLFTLTEANAETTATVRCVDAENVGSGSGKDRVCLKDDTAYCRVDNYNTKLSIGKCSNTSH